MNRNSQLLVTTMVCVHFSRSGHPVISGAVLHQGWILSASLMQFWMMMMQWDTASCVMIMML